jgi:hypothetical protein
MIISIIGVTMVVFGGLSIIIWGSSNWILLFPIGTIVIGLALVLGT